MHRPNNSERFAFERMARTNNRDSLRKVLMIGSVSYVPCSRGCLSCGPGTSARKDHRRNVPAGSDGRESFEPRSEEHTSELQSRLHIVCRLLLEKKKKLKPVRT